MQMEAERSRKSSAGAEAKSPSRLMLITSTAARRRWAVWHPARSASSFTFSSASSSLRSSTSSTDTWSTSPTSTGSIAGGSASRPHGRGTRRGGLHRGGDHLRDHRHDRILPPRHQLDLICFCGPSGVFDLILAVDTWSYARWSAKSRCVSREVTVKVVVVITSMRFHARKYRSCCNTLLKAK